LRLPCASPILPGMSFRYGTKWPEYRDQWDRMVIKPDRAAQFEQYATSTVTNKPIYLRIAGKSGVTWPHIAVLHRRESDANFHTYLGNGDSLGRPTTHVPKGRGPFLGPDGFVNGSLDALHLDGLDSVKDWRLEKILYYCEIFNGTGYANKGRPSPYIWGGTNIQVRGKYTGDGWYNPLVWDSQPGCAPLLWMIAKLDPTVTFARES
jgi:lysozyme family protein